MTGKLSPRRLAFLLGGVALLSLAGAFYATSGLGMDPLSELYSGIAVFIRTRLGTALFLTNAAFLLLLFFLDRKRIGLGTLAIVIVVGPLLNLLLRFFPAIPDSLVLRLLFCGLGIVSGGFGMAFYLHADLGCGPTDGLMLWMQSRTPLSLRWFKVGFDILCVVVGGLLGGSLGVGTVLSALLSGPAMCAVLNRLGGQSQT